MSNNTLSALAKSRAGSPTLLERARQFLTLALFFAGIMPALAVNPGLPLIGNTSTDNQVYATKFAVEITVGANTSYSDTAQQTDHVKIMGHLLPPANQVGKKANLFVVNRLGSKFFMKNLNGVFVPWNGRIADLMPAAEQVTLSSAVVLEIFNGAVDIVGNHDIFLGYMLQDSNTLIHSSTPARLAVVPSTAAINIAPLGSPRILVNDAATLVRLRTSLSGNTASASRFKTLVDAEVAGARAYGFQPWYAALMGQVTGAASYCRFAIDRTEEFVASEEALIRNNQRAVVAADSYLYVGSTIGNVALVYDWCRSQMTAAQLTRWANYGNQAVWNVWNYKQAQWGSTTYAWSGWSIDNPSNNYYYSFLRATMLLGLATYGENTQAQAWIDKFRTEKFANELVPTFNRDLVGGGSREGTGYGTAMARLFELYYWWEKSTGERIADVTPHALASLDKFIHDIVPTLDRISPTGDHSRDSTALLFDYHREYLAILSQLYPTDVMSGVSKTLLAQSSVPRMGYGFEFWVDFLYDQGNLTAQPLSRLATARWSSGTGQFSMRSSWNTDATYANLICGPYTESHAHRDQGSFVFFKGNWLALDENIYSHSGIAADEVNHNLVRIEQNGAVIKQVYNTSCSMLALADTPIYTYGLASVTPVYGSKSVVAKMEREFLLIKPSTLVVLDRVQTTGTGVRRVWTLNLPGLPTIAGDRFTAMSGNNQLDVVTLAPTGLTPLVVSWPSANSDMSAGYRVDVADSTGDTSVFLNVLGADRAFSTAVRSDAAGQIGALITLANGSTATVRFSTAGTGGTLEVRDQTGQVTSTGALPTTIQALPRLAN